MEWQFHTPWLIARTKPRRSTIGYTYVAPNLNYIIRLLIRITKIAFTSGTIWQIASPSGYSGSWRCLPLANVCLDCHSGPVDQPNHVGNGQATQAGQSQGNAEQMGSHRCRTGFHSADHFANRSTGR